MLLIRDDTFISGPVGTIFSSAQCETINSILDYNINLNMTRIILNILRNIFHDLIIIKVFKFFYEFIFLSVYESIIVVNEIIRIESTIIIRRRL